MRLGVPAVHVSGRRRIQVLSIGKWLAFPLLPLVIVSSSYKVGSGLLVGFTLVCLSLFAALTFWEISRRRQFIRESHLPRFLGAKLREQYPHLSSGDVDLVARGLRQFFMAHLRSNRQFVAMPSRVVDAMWHEFILHTRAYDMWCQSAFGRLMHHTPAEVLGSDRKRNNGLRRTWYWACKEESIDPRQPGRLPLLFALDKKFAIPGGFAYVPDCRDIDRQSGSGAYCGTSFGEGGGGSDSDGDAASFGGSESSGDGGGGDGGGCGGGD
ncbi:MAG TPA: hypothetical protein PK497_06830 [Burkholderiaceae bacterium]|jgi:hypothetical protein|nr:hypothetical protein [Burkholderiaceae bacterium]